jgi:hypothetical protein
MPVGFRIPDRIAALLSVRELLDLGPETGAKLVRDARQGVTVDPIG